MKTLYTAKATATGGREGRVVTDDKKIDFPLSKPANNQPGTNPEQLFAAGYSACFGGAVQYLAKQKGIETGDVTVNGEVSLNQDDSGFVLSAALDVLLPGMEDAAATDLVKAAHQFCPYSKATHGNITMTLKVNGKEIN